MTRIFTIIIIVCIILTKSSLFAAELQERMKRDLIDSLFRNCKQDQRNLAANKIFTDEEISEYCQCYSVAAIDNVSQEELDYFSENNTWHAKMEPIFREEAFKCQDEFYLNHKRMMPDIKNLTEADENTICELDNYYFTKISWNRKTATAKVTDFMNNSFRGKSIVWEPSRSLVKSAMHANIFVSLEGEDRKDVNLVEIFIEPNLTTLVSPEHGVYRVVAVKYSFRDGEKHISEFYGENEAQCFSD